MSELPINLSGTPTYKKAAGSSVGNLSVANTEYNPLNDTSLNYVTPKKSGYDASSVTMADVASERTGRFKTVMYGYDNEEAAAQRQSILDKAANGILKGVNLTATTVAGGFGMLYGAAKAANSGRLADIWDNGVMRRLDEWNREVDDKILPNYYTKAEKDAAWYSPSNWFTANFLFDKLIKNSGYAVGAMVSGNVLNAGLVRAGSLLGRATAAGATAAEASQAFKVFSPLLRNTSRAFSAGKNIEAAAVLESQISSIADVAAKSSQLAKIAKTTSEFARFGDAARRTAIAAYSSAGEASFEALMTGNEFRESLIQEYIDKYGENPTGEILEQINQRAEQVGKTSFFGNLALLGATEYVQLPYLLGSSYKNTRQAANAFAGRVDDVIMKDGKYITAPTSVTKLGSLTEKAKGVGKYIFDPKEAAQEVGQFALQVGTQNYFSKGAAGEDADLWVDGFLYGFIGKDEEGVGKGALVSKEGMESFLLGGLTGGPLQAKSKIAERKYKGENTQRFLEELNRTPSFKESFVDKMNSINRGVVLQQQHEAAIITGNELEARDLRSDMMHNYLAPRIKYGRFDMVLDDVSELREMSATETGLAELKAQGVANINDTIESFQKRLNNFERVAKNTNEIYNNLYIRYAGEVTEEGERKYSPYVIDKMAYAASKVADYDLRIPQLNSLLIEKGILVGDLLETSLKDERPSREVTADILNEINNLPTTSTVKDGLKTALQDIITLGERRKAFMDEYENIKSNPLNYESDPEFKIGDKVEVLLDIKGVKEEVEIGKEYSLEDSIRIEDGKLILAPKLTVLSQTLGGELEVKMPSGKIKFIAPENIKKYKLSEKDNTSPEMKKVLYETVSDVLARNKYKDIKVPENVDPLDYINSLGDDKLINDIKKEFNIRTKEIIEKKEKAKKEAEQLKKNKEDILKEQDEIVLDSGGVGTNNPDQDPAFDEKETKIPDAKIMFVSSTSQSEALGYYTDEEGNVSSEKEPAFVTNSREFLNNVGKFKNKSNMRAILVTAKLAKAYGLDGIVELSYGENLSQVKDVNDVNEGFIAQVFVEQVGNKLFFVDKNGNQIGEFGKQVANIGDVIFQTMRTTSLTYRNGKPRYRKDQKEEAEAYAKAWAADRKRIFSIDPTASPVVYGFKVSRGIAKTGDKNNHIAGVLIGSEDESKILASNQTLIQIPTAGVIAHGTGEIKSPNGRPILVYNNNVEQLKNIKFSRKRAEAIYEAINKIAKEITEQSNAGKRIIINKKLSRFLQNVLYWRKGKTTEGKNQINISEDGFNISFSGKTYSITEIPLLKEEIVSAIENTYHNVNNKTLSPEMFNKPFVEYYMENGELKNREWVNYQTYLLSSKYPDGKARPVSDTPLYTNIQKPTEAVPYTHEQKYSTLIGLELPVSIVAKPAAEAAPVQTAPTAKKRKFDYDGTTENITELPKYGSVSFVVKEGEDPQFNQEDELFQETRKAIVDKLRTIDPNKSEEQLIVTANSVIINLVKKQIQEDLAVEATPVASKPSKSETSIEDKKADIEKRRQENLKDTGDPFDYVSKQPRADGKYNAFYTTTKESAIFDSYQEAVDWINSKYDAELGALEETPTPVSEEVKPMAPPEVVAEQELETKKADIERRRQEELVSAVTTPISYEEFVNTKPSKVIVNNFDVYEYDKDLKKYVVVGAVSSTGTSLESIAAREKGAKDIEFFKDKSLKLDTVNFFWSERTTGRSPITRLTSYKKRTNQGRIDERVGEKLVEINAKYDAELAALRPTETENVPADKTFNPKNIKKRGTMFRLSGVDSSSKMTESDLVAFKKWAAEKVPTIPYQALDRMIEMVGGKKAWGVFEDGVAKFVRGGLRGTEYHEVGEAIWNGMLTPDEQAAILEDERKRVGQFTDRETGKKYYYDDPTVSDQMLKERILDDFADYRVGKLPARNLREAVRKFFKMIMDFFKSFVTKPSLKDELFKAIESGKFKTKELSAESKSLPPQYRAAGNLTEEQTNAYVKDMLAFSSAIIFGNGDIGSIDKSSLFNLRSLTSNDIFNKIEEIYTEQGLRQEFGDAVWNELVVKTKQQLKSLFKIDFNEDDIVNINDVNTNRNDYAKDAFSTDWKKHAPVGIKFTSATLLETVPTNQENSTSFELPEAKVKKDTQTYSLLPYNRVFATMLDKLKNTTSISKVVEKLKNLANQDANYVRMFQRLGGDLSNKTIDFRNFTKMEDWRLFIEMYQVYTKQKPDATVQYISQGQVYSGSAMVTGIVNVTTRSWIQNMRNLAKEPDSYISYSSSSKTYTVSDLSNIPTSTPEQKIDFLSKLGVIFPIEAWQKLKEDQKEKFTLAVASIKAYLEPGKEIMNIQKKTLDVAGQYDTLATLLVNVTHPNQESTRINLEGKQTNSFADNNAPSVFENEFNEVATLDELLAIRPELNDIYAKGSLLLKKGGRFFDAEGNRTSLQLKVGYIEGTKDKDNNSGTNSVELNIGQRYAQEINQNLRGQYYIMIPADGSTEWMMNLGNHVAFEDVEQGKDGWDATYDIFRTYLSDDLNLALDYENRSKLLNVGDRAKELRFFKDYLPEEINDKIVEMISEGSSKDDIEAYIDQNIEKINNSVKNYIVDGVDRTIKTLKDNGQVKLVSTKEDAVPYYKYQMLDDNFTKSESLNKNRLTEDDLRNILTFANINYIINNIEYHKILFGDPYQFKTSKGVLDATKRYKSFLSPRRTTFDSPEFNTFLNEDYNSANGINLNPNDPGYHEFKSYINTVTVADVDIVGSIATMPNVPKKIREAYEKTTEGDAASVMMDGTYRELKIKNAQWSDEAEKWHQWQMAYTRNKLANKGVYTYTNQALKLSDEQLISKDAPAYTIDIVKPIVSGSKSGSNNINLVLDKTSQMPLYYSMVEGTSLEDLYVKMLKEKKGYIIAISGRKVGAQDLHDLYKSNGDFNDAPFSEGSAVEVSWKSYGIQVETAYINSGQVTRGSQITKLVTLDLFQNGVPIGKTAERQAEIEAEVKRNNDLLDRLHENGYKTFLKKLGIVDLEGSFKIVNKVALAKTLQDEMFRRELSDNVIDSIQLDENGEFIIPFEASPAYLQIKSILYSFVDKYIVSQKVNGGGYVQAPVTLWEKSGKGRRLAIKTETGYKRITKQEYDKLSEEEKKTVKLTDDTLKFYEDVDGKRYCEVMLPHWFKGKLGKLSKKSDAEILEYLNSTAEGRKILSGIGFRIPTQSMSSIEAFKVKGFLPQYMGKSVVVPSEITTKAGSDFDIDKLNMYLKSVYSDAKGDIKLVELKGSEEETKKFYAKLFDENLENKKVRKAELFEAAQILSYGLDDPNNLVERYSGLLDVLLAEAKDSSEFEARMMEELEQLGDVNFQKDLKDRYVEDMYRRALENEYFDSLEKIVTMPENFERLISPVGDDGLKKISENLDKLRGYDETKIKNRLLDRNYLTSLRHAFVTAKRWVGIAAVNITGHSLTQKFEAYIDPARYANISKEDNRILKANGGGVLLDHNTVTVDGKTYVSLSGVYDASGESYISDGLSGFATAFVDVAKDPYILKIIKSNLVVGTFMYLRRIGVPKEQIALFMNQPIIDEYITMLDNDGVKNLFDSRYFTKIQEKFPTTVTEGQDVFNIEELGSNIETYYANGKKLNDYKNYEQVTIFNEFLKYAKMAEYNFAFTQAINYDTTKFQSGDSLSQKQWRTEAAIEKNIISSVNKLLEKTFIGKQAEFLDKGIEALGETLPLDQPKFTNVTDEVLRPYAENKYLSKDKFDRIANKLKASFLDYIIQKRSDVATNLQQQLIDERDSVATMLIKAKQQFPNVQIINDLEIDSSGIVGGAQTIKLRVNDKDAYTENMYQGMMRELRDDPRTNDLYKGIVRLSILQGTYQSPISIKNIVPVEDYASYITPIIAGLEVDEEIRAFAESNEFQRNEWQDNDIVPVIEPKLQQLPQTEAEEAQGFPRRFQGLFKTIKRFKGGQRNVPGYFPTITDLGANTNKRDLLFINSKYDPKFAGYDVIKMPRAVPINKKDVTEGKVDIATGQEITNQTYAEMLKRGDTSLQNFYGYKKVKYSDGTPLVARYDEEGNPVYLYKFINLHGDGQYAKEYYGDGRPSVFRNGTQKNIKDINGMKVSGEIPDQDIIAYYEGKLAPKEDAGIIVKTIEEEAEKVLPSQSMSNISVATSIPQNKVSGIESYGSLVTANDEVIKVLGANPHSIDMIEAGFRTRTTRSESEMSKYAIKVGDVVKQFGKSANGTTKEVLTRVTAIHPKGSPGWKGTWSKEGWRADDVKVIDRFKDGAAAIEFEVIKPSQPVQQAESVKNDIKDTINKLNLEPGEYEIVEVNGEKRIIDKTHIPERIKKGYSKFYSKGHLGQFIERYGKKVIIPGYEDINLMMEQDWYTVFELTTGLSIQPKYLASTQKDILEGIAMVFEEKGIREVLKNYKKIDMNDFLLTKIAPKGLPKIENNNQNNCG